MVCSSIINNIPNKNWCNYHRVCIHSGIEIYKNKNSSVHNRCQASSTCSNGSWESKVVHQENIKIVSKSIHHGLYELETWGAESVKIKLN